MASTSPQVLNDWYHQQFCVLQGVQRRRILPSVDGACNSCYKTILVEGPTTSSRCVMCMRFRVTAPLLRSSRFCSCLCSCYDGQELDDAGVSDSDAMSVDDSEPTVLAYGNTEEGTREYRGQISDNSSRRGSTSSAWSNVSERFAIDMEEPCALHYPLSFREIHDVQMAFNLPEDRLRRQFPEIEDIHKVPRREEEHALPPLPPCFHCKRPQLREIFDALKWRMILCCPSCYQPQLSARIGGVGEVPHRREIESCYCRCLCGEMEDKKEQARPPCWLSFFPNEGEPAEWVLQFLGQRGFCLQDGCQDGRFCYYRRDMNPPTHHEIITGTWYAEYRQHFDDLALEIERNDASDTFPNGIRRDFSTYTTLPAALEAIFVRVDPNAFGEHYPQPQFQVDVIANLDRFSDEDFFDTFGLVFREPDLFTGEQHESLMDEFNIRMQELVVRANNHERNNQEVEGDSSDIDGYGSSEFSSERIANLHSYILENQLRAEENIVPGSDVSLVIEPDFFNADVELYRRFPESLQVQRTTFGQHLYERYQRIGSESGMMPNYGELMEVVRIELEFRNYLTILAAGTIVDIPARIAAVMAATPDSRNQLIEELHRDVAAAAETAGDQLDAALSQREANATTMPSFLQEMVHQGASTDQPPHDPSAAQDVFMSGAIQSLTSPPSNSDNDSDSNDSEYDYFADPATAEERAQAQNPARRNFDVTRRMLHQHTHFLRHEAGVDVVDFEMEDTSPSSPGGVTIPSSDEEGECENENSNENKERC